MCKRYQSPPVTPAKPVFYPPQPIFLSQTPERSILSTASSVTDVSFDASTLYNKVDGEHNADDMHKLDGMHKTDGMHQVDGMHKANGMHKVDGLGQVDGGADAWGVVVGAFVALFVQFGLGESTFNPSREFHVRWLIASFSGNSFGTFQQYVSVSSPPITAILTVRFSPSSISRIN